MGPQKKWSVMAPGTCWNTGRCHCQVKISIKDEQDFSTKQQPMPWTDICILHADSLQCVKVHTDVRASLQRTYMQLIHTFKYSQVDAYLGVGPITSVTPSCSLKEDIL
ncbi:hypothetical protein ACRRTK_020976 [Alexandromys fortis]